MQSNNRYPRASNSLTLVITVTGLLTLSNFIYYVFNECTNHITVNVSPASSPSGVVSPAAGCLWQLELRFHFTVSHVHLFWTPTLNFHYFFFIIYNCSRKVENQITFDGKYH